MTRLLRGELLKTATTRTILGFLVATVGFSLLNAVIIAAASGALDDVAEKREALSGLPVLPMLWGLVGVAGEYRHRTAAPAALVSRHDRATLLAGRLVAYAVTGLLLGAAAAAAGVSLALPLLADDPGPALTRSQVGAAVIGNLLACLLATVLGAAIGALVRSQVAGIILVLILTFVVVPLLAGVQEALMNLTPFGAMSVLSGMTHDTSITAVAAGWVLAAWTAALLVVALVAERYRDLA